METIKKQSSNSTCNKSNGSYLTCDSSILRTHFDTCSAFFNETKVFVSVNIDAVFDFDSFLKAKTQALDIPLDCNDDSSNDDASSQESEIFFADVL
jgi:hypothetical protein